MFSERESTCNQTQGMTEDMTGQAHQTDSHCRQTDRQTGDTLCPMYLNFCLLSSGIGTKSTLRGQGQARGPQRWWASWRGEVSRARIDKAILQYRGKILTATIS